MEETEINRIVDEALASANADARVLERVLQGPTIQGIIAEPVPVPHSVLDSSSMAIPVESVEPIMAPATTEIPFTDVPKAEPIKEVPPQPPSAPAEPVNNCPTCGKVMERHKDWSVNQPGWLCSCGYFLRNYSMVVNYQFGLVDKNLERLLIHSPTNPTTRALLEVISIDRIPPQLKNFDDIKFWFERRPLRPNVRYIVPESAALRPRPIAPPFDVPVNVTEQETGKCTYSLTRRGSFTQSIRPVDLMEIFQGCVDDEVGTDTLRSRIKEHLESTMDTSECNTEGDWSEATYEGHESTNTETTDTEININMNELQDWLYNFNPELAESFYG